MAWLTFFVIAVVALVVGSVISAKITDADLRRLVMFGIGARVVGAFARYEVIELAYSGVGDAKMYFEYGKLIAGSITSLDFSFLVDGPDGTGRLYGTAFIEMVTSLAALFVGDSLPAAFLVFSLISFCGLVLCVLAFREAFGRSPAKYASWVWFLPSLWFWPSSVGKEALMIPALGLVLWGYVGRHGTPRWIGVILGVALAGAIRPHVGAVFGLAVAVGELLRRGGKRGARRWLNIAVSAVLVITTIRFGFSEMGLGDADLEGLEEQFQFRAGQTEQGGSRIERASGLAAIPFAFINVLLRPFPWEARGISALSAVELWVFWAVVLRRRKDIRAALGNWRRNRFLVVAAPLAVAMTLLYGIAFANLGIIARQRVVLLPLLTALLALPSGERQRVIRAGIRPPSIGSPNLEEQA